MVRIAGNETREFRDLRARDSKVAELARLVSRNSHHFVTCPSFGLRTREDARPSNPNREKAWQIDRCFAMQTAF